MCGWRCRVQDDFPTAKHPSGYSDSRIRRVDQPAGGTGTRGTKKSRNASAHRAAASLLAFTLELTLPARNRRTRIPLVGPSQMSVGRLDKNPVPLPAGLATGIVVMPLLFRLDRGCTRDGGD